MNIKRIVLIIVSVIIVGVVVGLFIIINKPAPIVSAECIQASSTTVTIIYTLDKKFLPACSIISSGTTIVWNNQSSDVLAVAANPHPIHTGNKEVSGGKFVLELAPHTTSSVILLKKGVFGYHDHAHSSSEGVIKVQ